MHSSLDNFRPQHNKWRGLNTFWKHCSKKKNWAVITRKTTSLTNILAGVREEGSTVFIRNYSLYPVLKRGEEKKGDVYHFPMQAFIASSLSPSLHGSPDEANTVTGNGPRCIGILQWANWLSSLFTDFFFFFFLWVLLQHTGKWPYFSEAACVSMCLYVGSFAMR